MSASAIQFVVSSAAVTLATFLIGVLGQGSVSVRRLLVVWAFGTGISALGVAMFNEPPLAGLVLIVFVIGAGLSIMEYRSKRDAGGLAAIVLGLFALLMLVLALSGR